MNIAVILDNNVSKVQVNPFEVVAKTHADINFSVFVGEKNKANTASITLPKIFLNRKREIRDALLNPTGLLGRVRENKFPRMDYYYYSLRKYLKDFDVVYTQDITRSLYTLASLKELYRYKIILRWWENIPFKRLLNEKDALIAQTSLDKVDLFLPATKMGQDALLLEGVPEEKVKHIYPGIDINRFTPTNNTTELRNKLGIKADKIVVLFTGRLVPHKGIYTLLLAAKVLQQKSLLENLVFVIVGDGEQRASLERMANEIGVASSFFFTGHMAYDTIHEAYQMSDLFVLPALLKENIQEQFGFVLAEAMACEKPVIGSQVGGIPEVVGDAGFLVLPGDHKGLADAVERLAFDPGARINLGEKARKRAENLFSSQKNSEELLKAFRKFQ